MNTINPGPYLTLMEDLENEKANRIERAKNKLLFNIPFLDDAMIGMFKNDLVLVAGRSGQGKSELAIHIGLANALAGKKVLIVTLESEPKEVTRRLLYKLMCRKYWANTFRTAEKPSYSRWYAGLQEDMFKPYYDESVKELSQIKNLEFRYKGKEDFGEKEIAGVFASKKDVDLIVFDHLHYIDFADDNENRAHKNILKQIRDLVLGYGIPMVLVSHIRKSDRRNTNPVPDMEDIHGSSDIFKIATKAVTIAPVPNVSATPGRYPTYMKIVKCRQDGGLSRYTAATTFDMSRSEYDAHYTLGTFSSKGEFEALTNIPDWARKN